MTAYPSDVLRELTDDEVEPIEPRDYPIVGGIKYEIRTPGIQPHSHLLGFYGAKFTIRFLDGRVVETNNLWQLGGVAEGVADTAEFITEVDA